MNGRSAWRTSRGVALGLLTTAATVLAGCGSPSAASSGGADTGGGGAPSAPSQAIGTRTDIALPAALSHLHLVDSTGHRRTFASFRGKVLVLSDGMTLCQETCPLDTASVVATARAVDRAGLGNRVEFVTATVDPARDSVSQLAAYRRLFKPVPSNWVTLTGKSADIARLWHTLGVYTEKVNEGAGPAPKNWRTGKPLTYDVDHSDEVFFFDSRQHERFILEGPPHVNTKSTVPLKLYQFMDKKGHHNLEHPDASAWTVPQALRVIGWLTNRRLPGSGATTGR